MFGRLKRGLRRVKIELNKVVNCVEITEEMKGYLMVAVGAVVIIGGVKKIKTGSEIDYIKHLLAIKELVGEGV